MTSCTKDYKGNSLLLTSFAELPNSTVLCSRADSMRSCHVWFWFTATQVNTEHVDSIHPFCRPVYKHKKNMEFSKPDDAMSQLRCQFCPTCRIFNSNSHQLLSCSNYNYLWLAGYETKTVNTVLIGQHTFVCSQDCLAFQQHKLSEQNGLSCTRILLFTFLLTLQFSQTIVGQSRVRNQRKFSRHILNTKIKFLLLLLLLHSMW